MTINISHTNNGSQKQELWKSRNTQQDQGVTCLWCSHINSCGFKDFNTLVDDSIICSTIVTVIIIIS